MSLQAKIVGLIIGAFVVFGLVSAYCCYRIYMDASVEQHERIAKGTARLIGTFIDPHRVDAYMEMGENAEEYQAVKQKLENVRSTIEHVTYVYVYQIKEDGCHVVFDLSTEDLEGEKPGNIVPFDNAFKQYLPTLLAGGTIDTIISDERYGWLLTAYYPVKDENGKCYCYAACDVSMDWLLIQARGFLVKLCIIFFVILLVVVILVLWYLNKCVVQPINTIARLSSEFAYHSKESTEKSLDNIKAHEIHTKDEIENLYRAFVKMANDCVEYIEKIWKKNQAIEKMQNVITLTLADIVEKRDKNTGEHIYKTASYVRIIIEELKREGEYAEELTEEFLKNVINSSPLHDIGKINVPDAILNKPGKLTDEEFAIMKSHAAVGGRIIGQIIKNAPKSGFLKEAKNLATYHHEKWNGKGYPKGLAGYDIPLSARIMAVADVFDALVSNRSYKKVFPYEKAFAIIREESGTHFDPTVVNAFFAAQDEVIKVAEYFSKKEKEGSTDFNEFPL